MNKQAQYNFRGINQDTAKNKHSNEFYFEGQHIRVLSTDSQATNSLSNERGNSLILEFPEVKISKFSLQVDGVNIINNDLGSSSNPYNLISIPPLEIRKQITNGLLKTTSNNHKLLSYAIGRDSVILFTTDKESEEAQTDCIWELKNILNGQFELELLYVRNLGFSEDYPIQAIYNYENENIQKVYWVDGLNQIRFLNIRHNEIEGNDPLLNIPLNSLNFVGNVEYNQPKIIDKISGGDHTAGMIQYAYNLYRLNSSQTKLSPLSDLIPLDKGINLGGGELNEIVSQTPVIKIENIDDSYSHIKVYAIKYTSLNQIPSINLIEDRELNNTSEITIYDDGRSIDTLSLEEFLFLGSDPIIPKHIQVKENRLFPSNIKSKEFVLPEELDCRIYSFDMTGKSLVIDNVEDVNNVEITSNDLQLLPTAVGNNQIEVNNSFDNVPLKHSSINKSYYTQKYQKDGITLGGEGKFLKAELLQLEENELEKTSQELKFLKDEEIYRFGIEFYNNLGQVSLPIWLFDYITPKGNLQGRYNCLKVELKQEFYDWLNDYNFDNNSEKPVGYRILRANRTERDKTIISQGFINGMMANHPNIENKTEYVYGIQSDEVINIVENSSAILPSLQRVWNKQEINNRNVKQIKPIQNYKWLSDWDSSSDGGGGQSTQETYKARSSDYWRAENFQYNNILQFYNPEILFKNTKYSNNLNLNIKGVYKNSFNSSWTKTIRLDDRQTIAELKINNKLTKLDFATISTNPYTQQLQIALNLDNNDPDIVINNSGQNVHTPGLLGPSGSTNRGEMDFLLFNREFKEDYQEVSNSVINKYKIYGTPEVTERGQGVKTYNNDSNFKYYNTLVPFISDRRDDFLIQQINSFGAKNATLVLGNNNPSIKPQDRPSLDTIYENLEETYDVEDSLLITEITKPKSSIYIDNLYNGNSFEDKKRTNYVQIGDYKKIEENEVVIENAGDTFVQDFKLLKIGPTDTDTLDANSLQVSEIIQTKLETQIDLKNRNDISINNWDSEFQPNYDEYHQYNNVYSQQSNLIKNTDVDFTFRRVKQFDTRIQSTKVKIPNESIDSWTDLLVNEIIDLDGQYGPINNLVSFKDEIYAFQDEAIAGIQINPRVQVQANDGVGIELGTGNVLYNYKYLTTKSGSTNKWSIIPTKRGIYYYDILNKGIGRVPNETSPLLSDIKGMHTWFNNNYEYDMLAKDNPLIKQGIISGVDNYNHDVFFTFHQGEKSFTRCFNEFVDEFIDLKTYQPKFYINKGNILFIDKDNKLYQQNIGEYNNFFGETQSSYITLLLNPNSNQDTIFNNVFYNSELYLDGIDQPNKSLTHIHAWNEYQDSGRIPLVVGRDKNLRRKFREWKANIPRMGRNRIRNPWIFLKLELENESDYKLILHDIIINYSI